MNEPDGLERLVSSPRFAVYLTAAGGDRTRAVDLYHWNARLSGALHVELGYLEVALRNRLNDELTAHHAQLRRRPNGAAWFDEPSWVRHHWWDHAAQAAIDDACRRAGHRPPRQSRPDGVVAELSFGFWRYLVTPRYEQSLWLPVLDRAFLGVPGRTARDRRVALDDRLRVLLRLRNRVAHHEPLFRPAKFLGPQRTPIVVSIELQIAMIGEVLSWIDPDSATWRRAKSPAAQLLAVRR